MMKKLVYLATSIAERVRRFLKIFDLKYSLGAQASIAIRPCARFAMKNLVTDLDELCKLLWRGVEIFACLRRRHDAH